VDVLTPVQRRRNMAAIRHRDTKPELVVRSIIHRLGYRFRLRSKLPGHPDIVLPRHRKVVLVHGCFWHTHDCKYGRVRPATRSEFWAKKRAQTVIRDLVVLKTLSLLGWDVLIVWECWLRTPGHASTRIEAFLKQK